MRTGPKRGCRAGQALRLLTGVRTTGLLCRPVFYPLTSQETSAARSQSKAGDTNPRSAKWRSKARHSRTSSRRSPADRLSLARTVLRRLDALPVLDARTPEQIMGFDEHGLP